MTGPVRETPPAGVDPASTEDFADADVLVVGGGPVGLMAAIHARAAGFSVLVVEARDGPVDRACGEGLMPPALAALSAVGVDPPGHPFTGIAYNGHGGRRVAHTFRSGPGRGVRRTVLQEALADEAAGRGATLVRAGVAAVDQDDGGVTVRLTDGETLRTRWVLGCDGLHSPLRRSLGLERPPGRRTDRHRYGLRQHFAVAPWSSAVEVHWVTGRAHPPVELYVTPVAEDTVGVAALGTRDAIRAGLPAAIASVPQLAGALAGAEPASSIRGAGPLRQRLRAHHRGRVLLVGDASGYVDALTGEGLSVGFAQAQAAVTAINTGRPEAYESSWRRVTRDYRWLTGGLLAAATSPARGAIVPAATRLPAVFGAVVDRLAR